MAIEKQPTWLEKRSLPVRLTDELVDRVRDNFDVIMGEPMDEIGQQPSGKVFFENLMDKFEKLKANYPKLENHFKQAQEALQESDNKIEELQNQLNEFTDVNEQVETLQQQIETKNEEIEALNTRLQEQTESMPDVDESDLQELRNEIQDKDEDIARLQQKLEEATQKDDSTFEFKLGPHIKLAADYVRTKEEKRTGQTVTVQDILIHTFWNQVQYGGGDHFDPVPNSVVKNIIKKSKQHA